MSGWSQNFDFLVQLLIVKFACIKSHKHIQNFKAMQRIVFLLVFWLGLGFVQVASAQVTLTAKGVAFAEESESLQEVQDNSWSLYADEENKVYYIDFESLKVNLSDIIVKNENGQVLLKDDVFELPVNTIYELDFSQYGSGDYSIELRSFTGIIRKTISIK